MKKAKKFLIGLILSCSLCSCSANKSKMQFDFYNTLDEYFCYDGKHSYLIEETFSEGLTLQVFEYDYYLDIFFENTYGHAKLHIVNNIINNSTGLISVNVFKSVLSDQFLLEIKDRTTKFSFLNINTLMIVLNPLNYKQTGIYGWECCFFSPLYVIPFNENSIDFEFIENFYHKNYLEKINYFKFKNDILNYSNKEDFIKLYIDYCYKYGAY